MNDLIETISAINWERWSAPALSGLRIVLIVVVAWIAISVLQRAVRVIRLRPDEHGNAGCVAQLPCVAIVLRADGEEDVHEGSTRPARAGNGTPRSCPG